MIGKARRAIFVFPLRQFEQARRVHLKMQKPPHCGGFVDCVCREDRIRTCDPYVPNVVRYRAALLPES